MTKAKPAAELSEAGPATFARPERVARDRSLAPAGKTRPEVLQALRAERLVVKVGSSLLTDEVGDPRSAWLDGLAADVAALRAKGRQVVVVTSGAVALGRAVLGLENKPLKLEEKQAAAAAGQIRLASAWREALAAHGLATAQLLVTLDDTEDRRRYLNARATVGTLLKLGAVPVVNENDTVATAMLRFGDNDRLSARVAVMASAETLVLLSDVDGLYTANPRLDPAARHVPEVAAINATTEAMAGGAGSAFGTGGMASKLTAAKLATRSGCAVLLTLGSVERPLSALARGARCTLFPAKTTPLKARKHWIAASLGVAGALVVDEGAVKALRSGSSLLPIGVVEVEGKFGKGDAVLVKGQDGEPVAKGLSAYDVADARSLRRCRSEEIEARLGYRGPDEVVHRDDLVLL